MPVLLALTDGGVRLFRKSIVCYIPSLNMVLLGNDGGEAAYGACDFWND